MLHFLTRFKMGSLIELAVLLLTLTMLTSIASSATFGPMRVEDINDACKNAKPGDVILIANGVYDGVDYNIANDCEGTVDDPIWITAETMHGAVFTGNMYLEMSSDHTILEGIFVRDASSSKGRMIIMKEGEGIRLTNIMYVKQICTRSCLLCVVDLHHKQVKQIKWWLWHY